MAEGSGHVESADSTDWQPSSFPAVRVDQRGGSDQLLIRIITLQGSTALTTKLFGVLENEGLSVLDYHGPSTEEKVLHRFQVKVLMPCKLDIDDLKCKLHSTCTAGSSQVPQ